MGTVEEEWRQISEAEEGYEVSNFGRVRHHGQKKEFCEYGRDNGKGYLQTKIKLKNGNGKMRLIHRLVACEFLENTNLYTEVNHLDGDKKNNRVDNLEWTNRRLNMIHASKTGLKQCRFSEEEIQFIRHSSMFQEELAKMFGVTQHMISKIKRGINYDYY